MKCEEMVKDVYFVAGVLEGLSCMLGQTMTEAVTITLADCVDRLELVGAQLLDEEETIDLTYKDVSIYDESPQEAFGRVYPPDPEDTSDQ